MDLASRPVGVTPSPIPDDLNRLSAKVIGCAIEVHRALGPGLLESAYDGAFCIELAHQRLQFLRQLESPIAYRGQLVGAYRLDFLVEDALVVEVKSVECLEYVYVSQVLTYLRATGKRLGLILNFNVPVMKAGVRRVAVARSTLIEDTKAHRDVLLGYPKKRSPCVFVPLCLCD